MSCIKPSLGDLALLAVMPGAERLTTTLSIKQATDPGNIASWQCAPIPHPTTAKNYVEQGRAHLEGLLGCRS